MNPICLSSPAKINLHLTILGKRPDGYHDLSMLMEKVSLCDAIRLEMIPHGIEVSDTLGGDPPARIPVEKNLVYRAAQTLAQVSDPCRGVPPAGVRIHLTKSIPMGGGLGGGSSNAATVLKALNTLWGLHHPVEKLIPLAAKLGADVPFFLVDGPAFVTGIGDLITPLGNLAKLWIIIINPGVSVPTPWAYQEWDASRCQVRLGGMAPNEPGTLTLQNLSVRQPRTFGEVLQALHNDFETVVFPKYPEIRRAKEALLKAGAQGALMSGSGSTVFGLFETKQARDASLGQIKKEKDWKLWAVENLQ